MIKDAVIWSREPWMMEMYAIFLGVETFTKYMKVAVLPSKALTSVNEVDFS
jgi:hypothetical protein